MNNKITYITLLVIIFILCGCMTMMPSAHENFSPDKIQVVAKGSAITKSPGLIATPAISPDGKYQLKATIDGDIKIMRLDRMDERLIYDRLSDDEFDKMEELVEKDTTGYAEDKASANEYINQVSNRDAVAGVALGGITAGMEQLEEWAEGQRYIIDMAWSPDGDRIATLIYSPIHYKAIAYIIDATSSKRQIIKKFYVPGAHNDNVIYTCGVSWKTNNSLVYSYFEGATNSEFYKLIENNLNTGKTTILSENDLIKAYYSPDGNHVAFYRPDGVYEAKMVGDLSPLENYFSSLSLSLAKSDFSNAVQIEDEIHTNKRASWSKDSKKLAYVDDGQVKLSGTKDTLYSHNIDDGTKTNICTGTFLNTPLFMNNNEIYFFMYDSYVFKAIID